MSFNDGAASPRGLPMPQGNGAYPAAEPVPQTRDDTTRYLCAAAHLDSAFADAAIREFLVEDTRSISPSPGVDAAAVLGEAVAARTRCKLRDCVLLLLIILFLFLAPTVALFGWIVLALMLAMTGARLNEFSLRRLVPVLVPGGLLLMIMLFVPEVPTMLMGSVLGQSPSYRSDTGDGGASAAAMILIGLIFAVLLADRMVVWKHLNTRFWRGTGATKIEPIVPRTIYQFSPARFLRNLARYVQPRPTMAEPAGGGPDGDAARAGAAPVIVYRGYKPFVGAGDPTEPWSIAVPLEPLPDVANPRKLTTDALYASIAAEIEGLRRATALAPGTRLSTLKVGEQIIVSAHELIDHLAEPPAADFLRSPRERPFTLLRQERVQAIKASPLEWARYYQCYQVETWDRDFVVSVYVHVAVGEGTLYVEWTPCQLLPIKKEFQDFDQLSRSLMVPIGQSLLSLGKLPASIPGRLAYLLSFIRRLPQDRGVIIPDRYGAAVSLRELAAGPTVHNYFQLADGDRYLKTLESRLVLAVSGLLRDAGYSTATFDEQAATVINSNVQINGPVRGNVVAGVGNKTGRLTVSAKLPKPARSR